jgi:hypothetical protein
VSASLAAACWRHHGSEGALAGASLLLLLLLLLLLSASPPKGALLAFRNRELEGGCCFVDDPN